MRTLRLLLFVLLLMPFSRLSASDEASASPTAMIDALHAALLETMRNADTLGIRGRYQRLETILRDTYDFPRMAAVAAGSHWANMGEADRSAVVDAFAHFSIANYASRFAGYDGETFDIAGERDGPRASRLVDTQITRADGQTVPVTYVMIKGADGWRIVDVLLDKAISELAVRRSEYARTLAQGGSAALARSLNERANTLLGDTN